MSVIPPEVRAFMVAQIDSIESLDVLLAMVRRRDRGLAAPELAEEIGLPEEATEGFLAHFHAHGILEVQPGASPTFRYNPTAPETASVIEALVGFYKTHRRQVLAELLGPPEDGVRAFSDAFRIRRKKGS